MIWRDYRWKIMFDAQFKVWILVLILARCVRCWNDIDGYVQIFLISPYVVIWQFLNSWIYETLCCLSIRWTLLYFFKWLWEYLWNLGPIGTTGQCDSYIPVCQQSSKCLHKDEEQNYLQQSVKVDILHSLYPQLFLLGSFDGYKNWIIDLLITGLPRKSETTDIGISTDHDILRTDETITT